MKSRYGKDRNTRKTKHRRYPESKRFTGHAKVFKSLVFEADRIYLNTNEHLRADDIVESRDARFLKWCKRRYPLHHYERAAPILHRLRPIKSGIEVELIKRACNITEKAFLRLLNFIRPGVWEFEIEAEIYHEFLTH